MTDEFNNDSMLELYLFEATTLLENLDNILLEAEQTRALSEGDINEIFRVMHTIKGSSAMMAFDTIAEVAHHTEDVFSVVRENGLSDSNFDGLFDLVLRASNFLETEVQKIQEGTELSGGAPGLIKELKDYEGRLHALCPSPGPKPDLGRMLGEVAETHTEPADAAEPTRGDTSDIAPDATTIEAVNENVPLLQGPDPADMPVAPEGGRILGIEPEPIAARRQDAPIPEPQAHMPSTSAPGGENTVYLHVYFNEGARMENIRAFMLKNKLSELGKINRTIPDELEDNDHAADYIIENGFYISYTSNMFREQIEALTKGTLSVESVSFVRKMPDEDEALGSTGPEPVPVQFIHKPEPVCEPDGPLSESPVNAHETDPSVGPALQKAAHEPERGMTPATEEEPDRDVSSPIEPAPAPAVDIPVAVPTPQQVTRTTPEAVSHAPARQNLISVDITKLDSLLDLVGEIVINESMVTGNPDLVEVDPSRLEHFNKAARQLGKLTDELQDSVMSVRMVPIQSTFQRMRRGIRDMSKQLGKSVELSVIGETTEVDKTILDAIGDPIMHLVRNAVDHAIETPEERTAAGKSPTGHITLSAQNVGGDVIISVSDDGRGLDRDRILAKAESRGLLKKSVHEYTDREIHNLLTAPGFSTMDKITEYSGRGVGLDVVKVNIERIGGSVIIESVKGLGTNILLKIPLTLAIIDCMEIRIGEEIFAIPITNIKESFKPSAGQFVVDPHGNEMIMMRGAVYPIVRLYRKFGIDTAVTDLDDGILILTDSTDREGCLFADELIGKFQVVVKSIPLYLKNFRVKGTGISGCTIMGNGDVSLILDVQELLS
ncbi:MAG: chemotaxis protein CheA [Clostridiales Family XIII bacterium]|jgi:two-component system chemotaxis sensor kinase CheA|nr:chemotaxis protein CheA [Clostridiales Family XIII bacterium]